MNFPDNLKYTKEHEWILVEGSVGTIGITEFAQSELGDVVFVDLNTEPRGVAAGESLGSIEAVKTVSEVYAPCGGKLIEVNTELADHPELVNTDPYNAGWMLKIEIADLAELNSLLDSAAYKAQVEG
ncbi:MAG: glycine cleavage system protein GcvH [Bacteroidota bacterium]|nr:glycine cleavage system protein GcvH [Bacteroidota bacterium]